MKRSCWNEIKCIRNGSGDTDSDDSMRQSPQGFVSDGSVVSFPAESSSLSVQFYRPSDTRHVDAPVAVSAGSGVSWDFGQKSNVDGVNASKHVSPEDIIAGDFNHLTLGEREEVYEEIHGVKPQREETAQFIDKRLAKMERDLKKLAKTNIAYSRALFLNRRYVKDRAFELMFLRSESYDPVKAAKRMAFHFEKKLELFGHEKLTKDIRWSSLDPDTVRSLEAGLHCLHSSIKDSVGRILSFQTYTVKPKNPMHVCHAKASWYRFMTALSEDEQTQQKGVVAVAFSHGSTVQDIIEGLQFHGHHLWISQALPFRVAGIHVCMQSEVLRPFFTTAMSFSPSEFRLRTKLHYGSMLECTYALGTFGIPVDRIPVAEDGSFNMHILDGCLQEMRAVDDRQDRLDELVNKNRTTEISERDVLLGRGLPFQSFPGTIAMTNIIKELKPEHDRCDRLAKFAISERVVQRVRLSGGRFLARCSKSGDWSEVSDQQARDRVAMGFRNLTRRQKVMREKESTVSLTGSRMSDDRLSLDDDQ